MLFSGAMVRALLAGTKTQTRRIVKPQPANDPAKHHPIEPYCSSGGAWNWVLAATGHGTGDPFPCPYGVPGDLLWVREGGELLRYAYGHEPSTNTDLWSDAGWAHAADGAITPAHPDQSPPVAEWVGDCARHKRPSIHMPRWASRLTLEITEVRVERLQDISEEDAIAEGVANSMDAGGRMFWTVPPSDDFINSACFAYLRLWDAINGDGSAAANPWVWAVSFKVHAANVDQMAPEEGSQSGGEPREDGSISRRAATNSPTITFPPGGKP